MTRHRRLFLTTVAIVGLLFGVGAYDALAYQRAVRFQADHAADPAAVAAHWRTFRQWHPTAHLLGLTGQADQFAADHRAARAQQALDDLATAEAKAEGLEALLGRTDQFLRDFAGTAAEADVRRRRDVYLRRLDERSFEDARDYSARQPLNFPGRRERYRHYLDRHPDGAFAGEARAALTVVADQWDRHDFRRLRDHYETKPADAAGLATTCRAYLGAHPAGRFTAAAGDLLRWTERVTAPGEYRVTLRNGHLDPKLARWLSRGPDVSVELEVAGVRYGPSGIARNTYDPQWDYEFPRRVRWKLGDPVRIRVVDHDYAERVVLDLVENEDPLAMRLLAGDVTAGDNRLTFESDFTVPMLPQVD
jgi:hypothetical protein